MSPAELRARWAAVQAFTEEMLGELAPRLWLTVGLHDAPSETLRLMEEAGADVESTGGTAYRDLETDSDNGHCSLTAYGAANVAGEGGQ